MAPADLSDAETQLQARLEAAALASTKAALPELGGKVRATLRPSPEIPGMVLFTGTSDPAERGRWHVGLLDDLSGLALPQPLGRKVLEAWSYGPRRTVPAADVAGVFAYLLAVDEDPNLLRRDKQVSRLREALRAKAFAPRDVVADGLIGVQWWDNTGQDRALVLHTLWVDGNHASTHLQHSFEEAPLPTEPVPTPDGVPPGRVDAEGAG